MPTFSTPGPITATIELALGDVRLIAGDRADTVVDVRPSDADNADDRRAAEATVVEYANGKLLVKAPRSIWRYLPMRDGGSVDVTVELPEHSHVHADAAAAAFRVDGPLGTSKFKTGAGGVRLDSTAELNVATAIGAVTVGSVRGSAHVTSGSGEVHLEEVAGDAVLKNANGDCVIGAVTGSLRCNTANGKIVIGRAGGDVTAKTANGAISVDRLTRGTVSLGTAFGDIEMGIAAGTAALLDVNTKLGRLRNELDTAPAPDPSDDKVEVRARTAMGDIIIRRS
ncbi:MAG: DUF4097 family beta strand repeat protein [Aldersonia sp.]|nr:DUF4097 family beta strand repeat protein [Aldersonia sp.]